MTTAHRRKSGKIDPDMVRRLHGEGLNDRMIAERIGGVTGNAVRLHRVKLGLQPSGARPAEPPEPEARDAAASELSTRELVAWLREINTTVDVVERGKRWRLNDRTSVDAAGLLAYANTKRARMGQPLFVLPE